MLKVEKISALVLSLFAFLLPLFFLPLTSDFYNLNKQTLLTVFTGLMLAVWILKTFLEQKVTIKKTSFNLPVLALTFSFILSTLIQSPNKAASLTGQTGIIISLALLFFASVNTLTKKYLTWILSGLLLSSAVISWLTVFAYLGLTENTSLAWLQSKAWTPTGSPIASLTLFIILLPATLFWAVKAKDTAQKVLLFLASALQLLGSILIILQLNQQEFQFFYLPLNYGWQIAIEGFKSFKIALFGVGPENFKNAFSQFKSMALNNTKYWTVLFNANSNELLNLLSTVGLLGLASFAWLAVTALKPENFKGTRLKKIFYLMLASGLLILLVLPGNIILWTTLFLGLLGISIVKLSDEDKEFSLSLPWAMWSFAGLGILLILTGFYLRTRVWQADYYFKKSLDATQANQGINTYNLQIKAISLNPYAEKYHLTYAQTNFALANSLASQKDLNDQDRENVSKLISQSIREAKLTINLNPLTSSYWASLADLYRNIMPVAQDAQNWAVSSYQQAVALDPTNPLLRIDFGGLYYSLKAYDQAIEQFKLAVNLKPDYANGYYNLSAAYKQKEDYLQAYLNLQAAVNLVPADSPDKAQAVLELEELKEKLPKDQLQAQPPTKGLQEDQLTTPPQTPPSPKPGFSNITLPEEAAPPESQLTQPETLPETSPEGQPATSSAQPQP